MHYPTLLVLAGLSFTSAVPANTRKPMDEALHKEILSRISEERGPGGILATRNSPSYKDFVPGCSKDEDPSYMDAYPGTYKIDQGQKLPKTGKDDLCTKGSGNDHCWNEYWIVEGAVEYANWVNTDHGTLSIHEYAAVQLLACDRNFAFPKVLSHTSNGFDLKILEASFEFAKLKSGAGFGLSSGVTYSHSDVSSTESTLCSSDGATNTCTWNDGKCHQVWFAQRNIRLYGYYTRVCNGNAKETVQQPKDTKNKNGRYVRGMWDYDFVLPINKLVGCNAACSDTKYTEPTPPTESKQPFSAEGWAT
ncbi:hypothetical protein SUNI508_00252 [Seiridium unicorne]|uniref:Uncharacterized protein n=1 Tax=Seiridium unicorne TaxID=138068 RepID=A0ABR2VIF0_9PEZI